MKKTIQARTNLGRLDASTELPAGKIVSVRLRNLEPIPNLEIDPDAPMSEAKAAVLDEMRREGVAITQPEVAARLARLRPTSGPK